MLNKVFILLLSTLLGSVSMAELSLFDDGGKNAGRQSKPGSSKQSARRTNAKPDFILRSTSRFGSTYKALLQAKNGDEVPIVWRQGSSVAIDGYRAYKVLNIGSKTVSIRLPEGKTCEEDEANGVKCTLENTVATLYLANAKPIAAKAKAMSLADANSNSTNNRDGNKSQKEQEFNPFANAIIKQQPKLSAERKAILAANRKKNAEAFRDFKIKKISEDEVPEGMRVVVTPFGDRLVPIK